MDTGDVCDGCVPVVFGTREKRSDIPDVCQKCTESLMCGYNTMVRVTLPGVMLRLRVVSITMNCLTQFPDPRLLPHVVKMDLSANRIAAIPASIFHMRSLKRLSIEGNRVQRLPPALFSCPLERLDARNNQINQVAIEVGNVPTLRNFTTWPVKLTGNPVEERVEARNFVKLAEILPHLHRLPRPIAGLVLSMF